MDPQEKKTLEPKAKELFEDYRKRNPRVPSKRLRRKVRVKPWRQQSASVKYFWIAKAQKLLKEAKKK